MMNSLRLFFVLFFFTAFFCAVPVVARAQTLVEQADNLEERLEEKRKEIEALLAAIEQYRKEIQSEQKKAKTFETEIAIITRQIKKLNVEIQALEKTLDETRLRITDTKRTIVTIEDKIEQERLYLGQQIRLLREIEHNRLLFLFQSFKRGGLVEFFSTLGNLATLQEKTKQRLDAIRVFRQELEKEKEELQEKQQEQTEILRLQELQRDETRRKEQQNKRLLQQSKTQAKKLKSLVQLSTGSVEQLKNEIYGLQRIGVTVQDAVKIGQLVAERTGIRAAFLIAVLEIESRLGLNVGSGTWKKDMHPSQRDTFVEITKELGLDPNDTPVSRKPSYGWGGAMGPAQFLPKTWLSYKDEVTRLTGHNPPSPWNIEDAFMASGIKLARDGASSKTREGELRATKVYLSGNPRCTKNICNFYSNSVLDKAADIERILEK